jgi:uncharacterized protein (DUF1778 family)
MRTIPTTKQKANRTKRLFIRVTEKQRAEIDKIKASTGQTITSILLSKIG